MITRTSLETLESLTDYLDGLSARATVEELGARLRALEIGVDDVADYVHFGKDCYLRNLIREGAYYHLLVLCWRSGQRSPIHNHAESTCGLRVLTGVVTETTFEITPSSLIKPVRSQELRAPQTIAMQDDDIHQVSNLEASGTDLITLHIYSPPLLRVNTFSLLDSHIGEFRPMILTHDKGSGI